MLKAMEMALKASWIEPDVLELSLIHIWCIPMAG